MYTRFSLEYLDKVSLYAHFSRLSGRLQSDIHALNESAGIDFPLLEYSQISSEIAGSH